jgi:hypothetical protein
VILYGIDVDMDFLPTPSLPERGESEKSLALRELAPSEPEETLPERQLLYRAHGRKVFLSSEYPLDGKIPSPRWRYDVENRLSFFWKSDDAVVRYRVHGKADRALLTFWFVHLFLPFYLTVERWSSVLHAGAVESDGKAILFLAPSTGGKSTLTDHFLHHGSPLVSDDKVALYRRGEGFVAAAAHPYHRPYRRFETLGKRAPGFSGKFLPLGALYRLERSGPDAEIAILPIHGVDRFRNLRSHLLYQFPFLKAEQFCRMGELLGQVPFYRVVVPEGLDRLKEVREAILSHECP